MRDNKDLMAPSRDVIAVVGMAGRFPGADTVAQFWRNLRDGVESVREFTPEELQASGISPEVLGDPSYVNVGAPLEHADCFDAAFFGYNPREAELMDPQQRLFLECAYAALQDAGYDPARLDVPVGVFGGVARNTYFIRNAEVYRSLMDQGALYEAILGSEKDFTATRVSFKLNLKGPAIDVQTACSTSGIGVHLACQSLLLGECDMALAGGARVRVPLHGGYVYVEGGIPSPDGHCRAFDAEAKGCVFGSGGAVLTLKRLADAIADGDQIHALILATAINNDGSGKVGFTAPSVDGQSAVIQEALALADVDAETIDYVEAHGTGTSLGDPVEIAALTSAFRLSSQQRKYCAIGSVKTNIGHLDAGAGVASLIKTILSLKQKQIPASLNFVQPNPQIDLDHSPFFVNDRLRDWDANGTPRRAGVSSFGLGGTNFHAILEEAPEVEPAAPGRPWQLLPLSARTSDALQRATSDLAEHLTQNPDQNLADTAYTLQLGRPNFEHRSFVVCSDVRHAVDQLRQISKGQLAKVAGVGVSPVVFMFPGQGAQHVNMGRELYQLEEVFRTEVDACCENFEPMLGFDLRESLYPQPNAEEQAAERLRQTAITQPALFVIEYALARLWQSWGIEPGAMIGHSVGEYVAATLAGVFSLDDALKLLTARGRLMQQQPAGSMLAVQLSEEDLQPHLSENVSLAACNAPFLSVVSGPVQEIEVLQRRLAEQGVTTRSLETSHAFHSAMMEPAVEPFLEVAGGVEFSAPTVPFISSLSGTWIRDRQATSPEYWGQQLRQPVHFSRGIRELQTGSGPALLEVGPGKTLSMLAQQHCTTDDRTTVVSSLRHPRETDSDLACMTRALGRLWTAGVTPDWERHYAGQRRRRVSLPTYPFERKRFWLPPKAGSDPSARPLAVVTGQAGKSPVNMVPSVESPPGMQIAPPTSDLHGGASQSPTVPPSPTPANISRKESLTLKITSLLEELSGMNLEGIDASTSFLDLGLDSLLLTQATNSFRKAFGVKVTFRQVMGDLSSAEKLSSYLDERLPVENFQPAEALRQQGDRNGSARFVSKSNDRAGERHIKAPVRAQSPAGPHGPFKPLDRGRYTKLTQRQQRHLDKLSARSIRKMAASKEKARQNRQLLADPRSVSGFKSFCKEMIYPLYTDRSEGSKVWDIDGNEYVDFVMGFGANLFGHRPPFVVEAVKAQLEAGFEIGPIHPMAGEVAALVQELTGAERVGFCNTGSEAVLAAIRVARTVSGRNRIAMFSGSYHGVFDEVLARPLNVNGELRSAPTAAGIPEGSLSEICVLNYGNPESLEILRQHGNDFAAVLVEPVQSRRLDLVPRDFLHELRQITASTGTALVFDEVVTGFRVQPGGAQSYFGIRADLATYGKVVGGGLPIGIVAGNAKYMDALDGGSWQYGDDSFPEVGVTFFAGTFVRHPLALAAAKSVLTHLKQEGPDLQVRTAEKAVRTATECQRLFARYNAPYRLTQFSSLMHLQVPQEFTYGGLLFYHLRDRGIHIFENRVFVFTTAHTEEDEKRLLQAMEDSLQEMEQAGFLPSESERESLANASADSMSTRGAPPWAATTDYQTPTGVPHAATESENRCSTLEEIQGEGERPPLFCMPAADGLTLVYHELADRLGRDQPVYGLNSPGALGEAVPDTIEEMATRFVEDIREIRPRGPYCLIGYCSGGTVAFEVAQQLVAAGEEVALVCGIETYDWSTSPAAHKTLWVRAHYEIQRLVFHFRNFLLLNRRDKRSFLRSKLDRTKSRIRIWRGMFAGLFVRETRQCRGQVDWNELWRRHDEMSVRYVPRPYPKGLLLIRPKTDYRKYVGKEELQALGGVKIVRIPAFPAGLMTPPYVDQVAKLVETSIDEGLRECGLETAAMNRVPAATKAADKAGLEVEDSVSAAH